MWKTLRKICWRRNMRRNLRKNVSKRDASCLKAATVCGGYYAYSGEAEWEKMSAFLQSFKGGAISFSLLAYDPDHKISVSDLSSMRVFVLDDKDLTFCKIPETGRGRRYGAFLEREYDLFIDFSPFFHFVDAGVVSLVKAKMKIGKGGDWGCRVNDLILMPEKGASYVESFIRSLETYLPFLRSSAEDGAGTGKVIV